VDVRDLFSVANFSERDPKHWYPSSSECFGLHLYSLLPFREGLARSTRISAFICHTDLRNFLTHFWDNCACMTPIIAYLKYLNLLLVLFCHFIFCRPVSPKAQSRETFSWLFSCASATLTRQICSYVSIVVRMAHKLAHLRVLQLLWWVFLHMKSTVKFLMHILERKVCNFEKLKWFAAIEWWGNEEKLSGRNVIGLKILW
jgi:hypothetical protein